MKAVRAQPGVLHGTLKEAIGAARFLTMTRRIDDLLHLICSSQEHPLDVTLRAWCLASRQVLEFMEAHATKLRKKVRLARSSDERRDLLAELSIGRWLAQDRRFQVQYEPLPPAGERGPDFEALYKGHTVVCIEVTRLRLRPEDEATAAVKLARVIADKVSQCRPGKINVLAVVLPAELQTDALVPTAVRLLGLSQESSGGVWTADQLATYRRRQGHLSGVLLCSFAPDGGYQRSTLWCHPQAKRPLPPEISRFLTVSPERTGS